MGANPVQSEGQRTYYSISGGKFAVRVKEDTPNAVKRVITKKDNSEKVVYELLFKDIDAKITSVEIDESGDFGDQVKIFMEDAMDKMVVTISLASREAKSFLSSLANIDFSKEVTLAPFNFVDKDGKKVIGMNVYQGQRNAEGKHVPENKVPRFFTKENPNGLPQVPEEADKDEFKLAMKQQEIFLKKWTKKWISERSKPTESQKVEPEFDDEMPDNSDDLPF